MAAFGGRWVATGLEEVSTHAAALDGSGRWAVSVTFEGRATLARFGSWQPGPVPPQLSGRWHAPSLTAWTSSLDAPEYVAAVGAIREHIARGEVYQANLCRTLRARLDDRSDVVALHARLVAGNPAPYAGVLRLPDHGLHIASASPELYLRRDGDMIVSKPIKGTGVTAGDLLPKDSAENVMIVDLVRNDLGRVCRTGSVHVPELLVVEDHPGLVHLVSTVRGELAPGVGWPDLIEATFPPGSVTGAPKLAALDVIEDLEAGPRGPYCGAFGWVDADTGQGELAVAIRTFWVEHGDGGRSLAFGTGAGITWDSDPTAEWHETELKAHRLLRVACDEGER